MKLLTFKGLGAFLFWIVAPLIIGGWAAQELYPKPAVGIITLQFDIWAGSADLVIRQIEEARKDSRIQAVVLHIDSPGGVVVPTQAMYAEVLDLRQDKPVVGYINHLAASGGFYLAMAAEPLYAQPSSIIGNVGVWSLVFPDLGVTDLLLASGPFKLTATNQENTLRDIDGIKQEFLATVLTQRGDRLNMTAAELSQGLAYAGREALKLGLIDHLGSRSEAVKQAAEMAGLVDYEIIDLEQRIFEQWLEENFFFEPWVGAADPMTGKRALPPGIYLLYDKMWR